MNLRSLHTLAAIDDHGGFARAAERLGMTLSAVSMQMKTLERDLDAALFDREFRPPRLTPVGRRAAAAARDVIAGEATLRAACAATGALAGDFRLGFVQTASTRILPRFLARARDAAPDARFEVETGLSEDLSARVAAGLLDAALVTEDARPDATLALHVVAEEPLVFAAPTGAGDTIAACLAAQPFLQFSPRTGVGRPIALWLARALEGVEAPPRIVLDNVVAIADCVAAGIGCTLLPAPDLQGRPGDMRLFPLDPPVTRRLTLVTRRSGGVNGAGLAALMRGGE